MGRVIAAVLVSNLALSFAAFLWLVLTSWWLQEEQIQEMPLSLALSFVSVSSLVATSVLPFSLLLAVLGWKLDWRSQWGHALCGATLGFKLGINFFDSPVNVWTTFFSYVAAGIICGWIYWAIAIKRTSKPPRAIDAA